MSRAVSIPGCTGYMRPWCFSAKGTKTGREKVYAYVKYRTNDARNEPVSCISPNGHYTDDRDLDHDLRSLVFSKARTFNVYSNLERDRVFFWTS